MAQHAGDAQVGLGACGRFAADTADQRVGVTRNAVHGVAVAAACQRHLRGEFGRRHLVALLRVGLGVRYLEDEFFDVLGETAQKVLRVLQRRLVFFGGSGFVFNRPDTLLQRAVGGVERFEFDLAQQDGVAFQLQQLLGQAQALVHDALLTASFFVGGALGFLGSLLRHALCLALGGERASVLRGVAVVDRLGPLDAHADRADGGLHLLDRGLEAGVAQHGVDGGGGGLRMLDHAVNRGLTDGSRHAGAGHRGGDHGVEHALDHQRRDLLAEPAGDGGVHPLHHHIGHLLAQLCAGERAQQALLDHAGEV